MPLGAVGSSGGARGLGSQDASSPLDSRQGDLKQFAQGCVPLGFEHLQGRRVHSLPGHQNKGVFSLSGISCILCFVPATSCHGAGHQLEESGSVLFSASHQAFTGNDEIPEAERPQLSQPALSDSGSILPLLQGPLLSTGSLELTPQLWSRQRRPEQNGNVPRPTGAARPESRRRFV